MSEGGSGGGRGLGPEIVMEPQVPTDYPTRADGIGPVVVMAVSGEWIPYSQDWALVSLFIRVSGEWAGLTPVDSPLMVARRTLQTSSKVSEVPELTVISALKRYLSSNGAVALDLRNYEHRPDKNGGGEWSYWATLGAKLSVAVKYRSDGTVAVIGLH